MKIAFISNFLCHHQLPFCQNMLKQLGEGNFTYIATTPTAEEQLRLGYPEMNNVYPFVIKTYEDDNQRQKAQTIIDSADVVIRGGSAKWQWTKKRLESKKLTLAYYERPYKNGFPWKRLPRILLSELLSIRRFSNYYLLCASAFTARDFALTACFKNKCYKWGYFPEVTRYADINKIIEQKKQHNEEQNVEITICWCARFIFLKNPESAIHVAETLKQKGYRFKLNMIGIGPLEEHIRHLIESKGLQNNVSLLGAMSPEEVRRHMELSDIFLFTSNKGEGWGAVLNESMNSACAVVASHVIGSVPFLIKDKKNGLIFVDQDWNDLSDKVEWLINNPNERRRISLEAYKTMTEVWCAENGVNNMLQLIDSLQKGEDTPIEEGPCSKAPEIKDNWYLE